MPLPNTQEMITSPDGILCKVLDSSRVDFTQAVKGHKSANTLVKQGQGGEVIETKSKAGLIESTYTAKAGDAIFININNPDDVYVPGNPDGTRWQFSELTSRGYEVVSQDGGLVTVKSSLTFKILPGAVEEPVCIKDAWGSGQHQFLLKGSTLKLNENGSVTGIEPAAFKATWEIVRDDGPTPRTRPRHRLTSSIP